MKPAIRIGGANPFYLAGLILVLAGAARGQAPDRPTEEGRFARWEKDIAAFEKQDRDRPPPKNAVLFVGSSSIRRWDVGKSFPGLAVINRGFGGSELADSVHFAPRIVLEHEPRVIVLYAGDNDIAAGKTAEQVADDFRAFVRTVRSRLPQTRIIYVSIKPSLRRWHLWDKMRKANGLIAAQCKDGRRLTYLDAATSMLGADGKPRPELFDKDGLHLNGEGYKLWAKLLKPLLEPPAQKR